MSENENTDVPGDIATQQAQLFGTLSPEEQAQLSRCLFPDEDTKDVEVLGVKRELRPLPIKWARKLKASIQPIVADIQKGFDGASNADEDYDAEAPLLDALEKAAQVIVDFYGWEDVKEALKGDGLPLSDYQALAAVQVGVNGSNDFLLVGLRSVVRWMQINEMMTVRFQNMLTGPHS